MLDRIYTALMIYGYGGFLFVGYYLISFAIVVAELAGYRRKDPRFEGDKVIYRS